MCGRAPAEIPGPWSVTEIMGRGPSEMSISIGSLEDENGFVIGVVNNYETAKTELIVVDTDDFEGAPRAIVKLPFALHTQVHGWRASSEVVPFDDDSLT